jgi:hypothetical protein
MGRRQSRPRCRARGVPPTWVQVMAMGEKSGQLAQLAEFSAARLEEEAEDAVSGSARCRSRSRSRSCLGRGVLVVGLYAPMANLYQVLLKQPEGDGFSFGARRNRSAMVCVLPCPSFLQGERARGSSLFQQQAYSSNRR